MNIPFKPESPSFRQRQLFPRPMCLTWRTKNHDCFLFYDLFQQLDIRHVEAQYSPRGQHAYHPHQIISILIYGDTHGVFSSRQLEKRCNEDLSFMYIAGQNGPNFRVHRTDRQNNSKHFAYEHRQEKKAVLLPEIDDLIAQANASDAINNAIYLSIRGDELPSVFQL